MPMEHLTINVDASLLRREELDGVKYLVAPLAMMTEGVHEGSSGALFYEGSELKKWTPAWNHKPITVNHPEKDGEPISGSDPEAIKNARIGLVLNASYDNKQRAEGWFDEILTKTKAPAVYKGLQKKKMMELSTGLLVDIEGGEGTWNGKKYKGTARNHRPDHLAILPDRVGACSVKDGAGVFQLNEASMKVALNDAETLKTGLLHCLLNRGRLAEAITNELSHSAIHSALREELNGDDMGPTSKWIEEVYDNYFIYFDGGELKKQKYSANSSGVTLVEDPIVVERMIKYRPVSNAGGQTEGDESMAKKEIVDGLIANKATSWEEKDRDQLMLLNEDILKKMVPEEKKDDPPAGGAQKKDDPPPTGAQNQQQQQKQDPPPGAPAKEPTVEEWIANAKVPEAIARQLMNSVAIEKQERARLIDTIVANKRNVLKKEQLEGMDINALYAMAELAKGDNAPAQQHQAVTPNYLGLAPVQNQSAAITEEPLEVPVLNFEPRKKAS